MDLLKTLLIYMSVMFAASVQTAPEAMDILSATPQPTPYVAPATPSPTPSPVPTPVPTIDITPNPAYKTLQMGDRGEDVRAMQEKLIEYGYLQDDADGAYGNNTRRAVEAFQYQHGLSADGIAGRRTLTVLYESPEIRLAPAVGATPEPTATAQLTVALTPSPTPTFAPVETVKVVKTQAPVVAVLATSTPKPDFEKMDEYQIVLASNGASVEAAACRAGEQLYLPVVEILNAAEVQVLTSSSIEKDEMAFVIGDNLIGLAYTENQSGEPINLEAYKNTEPQILPGRDIRRFDDILYLPASNLEALTGMKTTVDENAKLVTVTFP